MTDADTIMGGWASGSQCLLTSPPLAQPWGGKALHPDRPGQGECRRAPGLHEVKRGVHDFCICL